MEKVAPWQFDEYVRAEADGHITPDQLAVIEADPAAWRASLQFLLRDAKEGLQGARSLKGDERQQVVADFEDEVRRLESAVQRRSPKPAASRTSGREQRRDRAAPAPLGR